MSGPLDLDAIESRRLIACEDDGQTSWHERQAATWALLDDDGLLPALVAEVRALRAKVERVEALADEVDDVLANYAGKTMPNGGTWPGASMRTDVLSQRLRDALRGDGS